MSKIGWGMLVSLLVLAGCETKQAAPAEPAAPAKAAVPGKTAATTPATATPDAGTAAAPEKTAAGAVDPDHFVGFSADESQFAFSAYSEGAGFSILTVVSSKTGERITDIPLDSPAAKKKAQALLERGAFSGTPLQASSVLPKGERLVVSVPDGVVDVALEKNGKRVELPTAKDFLETSKHFGSPKAALWGFSPKGTFAAVRITQDAGAELGTAVAFHVVDVAAAQKTLAGGK